MGTHESYNRCCSLLMKAPGQIGFNKETGMYYLITKGDSKNGNNRHSRL